MLIAVLCLGAAIRLWFRRKGQLVGQDTWGTLIEAQAIRKNGFRIPELSLHGWVELRRPGHSRSGGPVKSPYDVPPLFFFLTALLPQKGIEQWSKYVPVLCDTINAALAAALVWILSGNAGAAILTASFFAITPSAVSESLTFNARPFAALLFSAFVILLAAYSSSQSLLMLAAAGLAAFLVIMTHKMTTQALIVTSVALSLVYSALYIVPLAIGFAAAFLLSGGYYNRVLRGHLAILKFWRKHIDSRRKGSALSFTARSLSKLFFNPWMVFVFFFQPLSPAESLLQTVSLALFAAAVLTSFKPLAFLGENHRYLEYSTLSSFAVASLYIVRNPSPLVFTAAVACIAISLFLLLQYQRRIASPENIVSKDFLQAAEKIRKSKRDVVLSIPDNPGAVAFFSGKRVFAAPSPTTWEAIPFMVLREQMDVARDAKKHGVGLVLVSRDKDEKKFRKSWRAVFENKSFVLYET